MNCSVAGCESRKKARGMCDTHYQRWLKYGDGFDTGPSKRRFMSLEPIARFWAFVALTANPEKCWEWQGAKISTGYGNYVYLGRNWLAHRLAWLLMKGSEPTRFLLHSCDNPKCVNPNHLREGSQKENLQEMAAKGRQWKQALRIKRLQETTI